MSVEIGERRQDGYGRSQWPVLKEGREVGEITADRQVRENVYHRYGVGIKSDYELGFVQGYHVEIYDFDGRDHLHFRIPLYKRNHNTALAIAKEVARRLA